MKKAHLVCLVLFSLWYNALADGNGIGAMTTTAQSAPNNDKQLNTTALPTTISSSNNTGNANATTVKPNNGSITPDNSTGTSNMTTENPKDTNITTTTVPSTTGSSNGTTSSTTITSPMVPTNPTVTTTTYLPPSKAVTPVQARGFDGGSFVGGIILTLGLLTIGFIGFKYYKKQQRSNYSNF